MNEIRTYETFAIRWFDADGNKVSEWSNYDQADAELAVARSSRRGEVIRRTFDVLVKPEHAGLYRPGIASRPA